jgi:hypothetical protein
MKSASSKFRQGSLRKRGKGSLGGSRRSSVSFGGGDDERPFRHNEADWGIGDDARMGLE